ncbi:MAG: Hsp70 family protein [Acidobacteria bacterium]|nr:Hsp70 family protein [Acidobacteriota bacterium]
MEPAYFIGIDLGTTNSALAFVDSAEAGAADFPPIHTLPVPQAAAPGREETLRTLPSFLFLGEQTFVGAYAREQGALVPTRSVHSAKSWLSNPNVDRTAKILPWDALESGRVLSPVDVSARVISHLGTAWEKSGRGALGEQEVVLTVPASFDEEARELTVEAARAAGVERLTLLEEPAAAFYSWIANHLAQSRKSLFDGQTVLVCDVGGGTSDFTLIRVARQGDRIDFTRTAVGRHLLLGGDNLDLTLAWLVESKLGKPLSVRQRSGLRRQCAAAKERLLSDASLKSVEITVLGGGSSIVGGTLRTEILREEALELALEGFLPVCGPAARPGDEDRSLFQEVGLPYVSDPAVTRHLAAFLAGAGAQPDAILFNGGFFIPEILRDRVADVLGDWYGRRPAVFDNHDLDLAVAVGAAYYSYVRSTGAGLMVRGGLPRTYFLGAGLRSVCLVPRGAEEGQTIEVDLPDMNLVANKAVSFRLYSALNRTGDQPGDVVEFGAQEEDLHAHAPLNAVIRFGKPGGEQLVPVKLGARLTEVGTLEIWCQSKISEHRWRLEFELRKQAAQETARAATVVSEEALRKAEALLQGVFSGAPDAVPPEELPGRLEQTLALGRTAWPLDAIRRLADVLLERAGGRRGTAALEARWLNLCGLCLRPGFGYPGDDYRIEQARRILSAGLAFASQVQNEIEAWIFWGRVAGGLNRAQQIELFQRLAPTLLARGKPPRVNSSLLCEMWRAAASFELLPLHSKTELGEALLARARKGDARESEYWCLARLGARDLFYGPINQVLPPATAARWAEALVSIGKLPPPAAALEAVALIARRTGQVNRDLPGATLTLIRRRLEESDRSEKLLALLEGASARDLASLGRVFGEELPSGLVFRAQE